jgi:hypothetical protein
MVDLATDIQQRYIEIIPVATDVQPDGTIATNTILHLVNCMQQLYQRTATLHEVTDMTTLANVALCLKDNNHEDMNQAALIKRLTTPEHRSAIVQEFSIIRTMLLMVKNGTFSTMNGLKERHALLSKAVQGLPLAKLIPLWKLVN